MLTSRVFVQAGWVEGVDSVRDILLFFWNWGFVLGRCHSGRHCCWQVYVLIQGDHCFPLSPFNDDLVMW